MCIGVVAFAGCGGSSHRTASKPAAAAPVRLDGVYQRSVPANADPLPENTGQFVMVIKGRRFAFTQEDARACTWQYGTVQTRAGYMTWDFINGGGKAPNHAYNKPGEHFVWKMSLYRGTLALQPVTPTDLSPESWRHTGQAPTAAALNPHCPPPAGALGE